MRFFRVFLFIIAFTWTLISCAPIQYIDYNQSIHASTNLVATLNGRISEETSVLRDNNAHVNRWIKYFTEGKGRGSMKVYLERSNRYLSMMKGIFNEYDLPEDLAYIAMVESGFQSSVVSSKDAVGYWQFIESTGKRYDLKIDNTIDERRDFILATKAAARYLKFLYKMFDDWNLAIAAYNVGEGTLSRVIHSSFYKDYWSLVDYKKLPTETSNFVPKIIAMKEIATHPWKYNFSNLNYYEPLSYRSINIYQSFSLKNLSEVLKVSHKELLSLNPKYKSDIISLSDSDQKVEIRIPASIDI